MQVSISANKRHKLVQQERKFSLPMLCICIEMLVLGRSPPTESVKNAAQGLKIFGNWNDFSLTPYKSEHF